MATPKEWRDNLERIQRISGTFDKEQIKRTTQHPEEVVGDDAVVENLDALATGLLILLTLAPRETHLEIIKGFIQGIALTLLNVTIEEVVAEEPTDGE